MFVKRFEEWHGFDSLAHCGDFSPIGAGLLGTGLSETLLRIEVPS